MRGTFCDAVMAAPHIPMSMPATTARHQMIASTTPLMTAKVVRIASSLLLDDPQSASTSSRAPSTTAIANASAAVRRNHDRTEA